MNLNRDYGKMKNYIKEYIGKFATSLREAMAPPSGSIDRDDYLYTPLGQTGTRDLNQITFERAVELSKSLFDKNPVANRIIRVPIEALKSVGLSINAEDDAVQSFIDEWWSHPIEGYKNQFYKDFQDNKLVGESAFPIAVNEIDGSVDLGFIDPVNIRAILKSPGNARIDDRLILKPNLSGDSREFDIIRKRELEYKGQLFYFGFNKPTNGTRSKPILINLLDSLDLYDMGMFSEIERWNAFSRFYIDVTLHGADEDTVNDYKNKMFPTGRAPKSNTVFVHNQKVEHKMMSPDLNSSDRSEMSRMQKQHIYAGSGMPAWMFGDGDSISQGVTREAIRPIIWMLEHEQELVSHMLYTMLHFNLLQAQKYGKYTDAGQITEKTDISFEVVHNSIFPKDLVTDAVAFAQVVPSIIMMADSGYAKKEVAGEIIAHMVNELLDKDIKPEDMVDELAEDPMGTGDKNFDDLQNKMAQDIYEK